MNKSKIKDQNLTLNSPVCSIAVVVYPEQLGLAPDVSADELRDKLQKTISIVNPFLFLVIGAVHNKSIRETTDEKHDDRKPHAHLMIDSSGGSPHKIATYLSILNIQFENETSFPLKQIEIVKSTSAFAHYISYVADGSIDLRKINLKTVITNHISGFIALMNRYYPATGIPELE